MKKYELYKRSFLGDTLTPVSVYLALRDHFADCKLLESAEYGKAQNSRSIIAFNNLKSLTVQAGKLKIKGPEGLSTHDLKNDLSRVLNDFYEGILDEANNKDALNAVGMLGYIGYNSIRYFESVGLDQTKDTLALPDLYFGFYEFNIVFDHYYNTITVYQFSHARSKKQIDCILKLLPNTTHTESPFAIKGQETVSERDEMFLRNVEYAKTQCKLGNVFQVVLSRRFAQGYTGDDFNVYRNLRHINPSPYMFYFDHGDFKLAGSSPETHIAIQDGKVSIHPIAGTIKRNGVDAFDKERLEKLVNDPKENAEHDMLIDLARNDLSIYCNNVHVKRKKEVQQFSHVYHLVSEVEGKMKSKTGIFDIIARTFPAGTLAGAPKYRAMQLIDEIESRSRDFYGGAIGFIDLNGNANLAILIRTFCACNGKLNYQAGAGITVESKPEHELLEVNNKINAVRKAIELSNVSIN
ncbi:MAG TPA: anthranilate synthase component I family protein [Flavobacteriales bacterium]|nr:anthranilate synthase component I family protein [Flavobacteriales bacterium]